MTQKNRRILVVDQLTPTVICNTTSLISLFFNHHQLSKPVQKDNPQAEKCKGDWTELNWEQKIKILVQNP